MGTGDDAERYFQVGVAKPNRACLFKTSCYTSVIVGFVVFRQEVKDGVSPMVGGRTPKGDPAVVAVQHIQQPWVQPQFIRDAVSASSRWMGLLYVLCERRLGGRLDLRKVELGEVVG